MSLIRPAPEGRHRQDRVFGPGRGSRKRGGDPLADPRAPALAARLAYTDEAKAPLEPKLRCTFRSNPPDWASQPAWGSSRRL